ncbi:hypothetical protein ACHAXT_004621 [Thalassiosira profunda]
MGKGKKRKSPPEGGGNPLLAAQLQFLASLPSHARHHFFSPDVSPEQRAEIWERQADLGEALVDQHAWATPDARLLRVFQHFGREGIVEVGCGANAYWARWMHAQGGVDVVGLDVSLDQGGKIGGGKQSKKAKNKGGESASGLIIRQGGPNALSEDAELRDSGRTLFLCYPDEEYNQTDEEDEEAPTSMAAACLEHFAGDTIIHVGELYGDTLSMEQAPFGRSSSGEFQARLAAEYHCILKMSMSNWLHVRDTLSVWKRSQTSCVAFQDDSDDEEEAEEAYYKYIPPEELLPVDAAAPDERKCTEDARQSKRPSQDADSGAKKKKKQRKEKKSDASAIIAGEAW